MSINQDLASVGIKKRIGLIVYLKKINEQHKLRHFGNVVYFSKKFSYCVLYVNEAKAKEIAAELCNADFVERVSFSQKDQVDLDSDYIEQQIADLAQEAEVKLEQEEDQDQLQ
ncbi:YlbG family protein [Lactobacillus sp. ESL0791]|uniref:YlbG family protein n=1 Tax=Lactobacillus sp. ESL0791 TaxID=2983234 RepID=UPI0023F78BE9|nr:YlbG family protein [Lactobacillus sp. ESL0791]MDF7638836.1 YlbG family protein [Lactobacillus sp. ESL0791]